MTAPERLGPAPRANAGSRTGSASTPSYTIDFETINRAALAALPAVLGRIVPGGKTIGREYVALNPTRADRRRGSFKINLRTGAWADFSSHDKGGDPVSLVAYVEGVSQVEAARLLGKMLGLQVEASR